MYMYWINKSRSSKFSDDSVIAIIDLISSGVDQEFKIIPYWKIRTLDMIAVHIQ